MPFFRHATALTVLLLWLGNAAVAQEILVTELMAAGQSVALDEEGTYLDWVEVFNPGTTALELGGWGLTMNGINPQNGLSFREHFNLGSIFLSLLRGRTAPRQEVHCTRASR